MALYAFDGTCNKDKPEIPDETNVVRFCKAYRGKTEYIEGVGTRFGAIGRVLGGIFGAGGKTRIEEMYARLSENWRKGDQDIDIIGFSRGAALAVHYANLIEAHGIHIDGQQVGKPRIRFLGLWDVVASFGIPINFVLRFHNINIGWNLNVSDDVDHCFHAMALNECRQTFEVTRLNPENHLPQVEELWFRGVHSDIGGGLYIEDSYSVKAPRKPKLGLCSIPFGWMLEKGLACGLPLDPVSLDIANSAIDPCEPLGKNFDPIANPPRTALPGDRIHPSAVGKTMQIGESTTFGVYAREPFSWSGARLQKGGYYSFTVPKGQCWRDASISCDPRVGWRSEDQPWYKRWFLGLFENRRRCPKANWFEVVGSLGDESAHFFRMGGEEGDVTYCAPRDGELYAFANDLPNKYGNNRGKIEVTVARVQGPGVCAAPACF